MEAGGRQGGWEGGRRETGKEAGGRQGGRSPRASLSLRSLQAFWGRELRNWG